MSHDTVGGVVRMANGFVRTPHHYDEQGVLAPTRSFDGVVPGLALFVQTRSSPTPSTRHDADHGLA